MLLNYICIALHCIALALKVVQVPSTGHETGDRRREKEDIINYDVRQEMVLCSYVWKI